MVVVSVINQFLCKNFVVVIGLSLSNVELVVIIVVERVCVLICGIVYVDQIIEWGYKFIFQLLQKVVVVGQFVVLVFSNFFGAINFGIKWVVVINDDSVGIVVLNDLLIKVIKVFGYFKVVYHQMYFFSLINVVLFVVGIVWLKVQVIVLGGQILNIVFINKVLCDQGLVNLLCFNFGGGVMVILSYVKLLGDLVNGEFVQNLWGYDMNLLLSQKVLFDEFNQIYIGDFGVLFIDVFVGVVYVCMQLFVDVMSWVKFVDLVIVVKMLYDMMFVMGLVLLWLGGKVKFDVVGVNMVLVMFVGEWCYGKLQMVYLLQMVVIKS